MTDGLTDFLDRDAVSTMVTSASKGPSGRPVLAELKRQLFAGLAPVVSGRDDATVVALHLSPTTLPANC
jgi:hypothetical protein